MRPRSTHHTEALAPASRCDGRPQGHWDCPSAGATVVTCAILSKNSARNLDGQFLDSEVVMKENTLIVRTASQCRFGTTDAGSGCQITRPAAVFCQLLKSRPHFHLERIDNHML